MSDLFIQTEQMSVDFRHETSTIIPSFLSEFERITPSNLTINTMTVSCKTSLQNFNSIIPALKDYLIEKPIEDGIELSEKSMGKNVLIFKIPQRWGQNMEFRKNISAKVFGNGSIHITGVTSPSEAILVSDYLCRYFYASPILKDKVKVDPNENECPKTTEVNICMIQSNFDTGVQISLPEAYALWMKETNDKEKEKTRVVFNTEKHHALHIKFLSVSPSLSAIIFSTGKVLITGARKPGQLSHAYHKICSFFDNSPTSSSIISPRVVLVKIPKKRGRKRKAEHSLDYNDISL